MVPVQRTGRSECHGTGEQFPRCDEGLFAVLVRSHFLENAGQIGQFDAAPGCSHGFGQNLLGLGPSDLPEDIENSEPKRGRQHKLLGQASPNAASVLSKPGCVEVHVLGPAEELADGGQGGRAGGGQLLQPVGRPAQRAGNGDAWNRAQIAQLGNDLDGCETERGFGDDRGRDGRSIDGPGSGLGFSQGRFQRGPLRLPGGRPLSEQCLVFRRLVLSHDQACDNGADNNGCNKGKWCLHVSGGGRPRWSPGQATSFPSAFPALPSPGRPAFRWPPKRCRPSGRPPGLQ